MNISSSTSFGAVYGSDWVLRQQEEMRMKGKVNVQATSTLKSRKYSCNILTLYATMCIIGSRWLWCAPPGMNSTMGIASSSAAVNEGGPTSVLPGVTMNVTEKVVHLGCS